MNQSTLTDNQHWWRSRSLRMGPCEPASLWEQPPVWNGEAETWDDWEREETLLTLSIRAPTPGPRLVRSLSHLPQVCDVRLSVPRVELVKNTGVAVASRGRCRQTTQRNCEKCWDRAWCGRQAQRVLRHMVTESWARHRSAWATLVLLASPFTP